jgi:hypothetical protein
VRGRLSLLIGRAEAAITEAGPDGGRAAFAAYLKACEPKDNRPVPRGKVKAEEKTKVSRRYKLKVFVDWAEARGIPFMTRPFTETIRQFLEERSAAGIQASTLWSGDYQKLSGWGEWMAAKRLCEPLNRRRILELLPHRPPPVIELPGFQADLDSLRFFRDLGARTAEDYADLPFGCNSQERRRQSQHSAWLPTCTTPRRCSTGPCSSWPGRWPPPWLWTASCRRRG